MVALSTPLLSIDSRTHTEALQYANIALETLCCWGDDWSEAPLHHGHHANDDGFEFRCKAVLDHLPQAVGASKVCAYALITDIGLVNEVTISVHDRQVLRVLWSDDGLFHVANFERGDWEQRLLKSQWTVKPSPSAIIAIAPACNDNLPVGNANG